MEPNKVSVQESFCYPDRYLFSSSVASRSMYYKHRSCFEISDEGRLINANRQTTLTPRSNKSLLSSFENLDLLQTSLQELIESSSVRPDLVYSKNARKIYYAARLTEQETRILENFKKYICSKNLASLVPEDVYDGNFLALRCLQSCAGDFKKAFEKMRSILLWADRNIPDRDNILENIGYIYAYGRDFDLRPVIVFNLRKLFESKIDLQTCIKSNHYLLEYLKSEVLVPGRIETWDFIVDLEGFNKLKYPKSSFEKIFKEFTRFYPSRANLIITINSDNLHKLIKKAYLLFKSTSEYYSRVYCGDDYKRTLLKYIPKKTLK